MAFVAYKPPQGYKAAVQKDNIQSKDFQDLNVYLAKYGIRTIAYYNAAATATWQTFYTVPAGYTFFMYNLSHTADKTAITSSSAVSINGQDANIISSIGFIRSNTASIYTNSHSYAVPIRIMAGETLALFNIGATHSAVVSVFGYLVANSILEQI